MQTDKDLASNIAKAYLRYLKLERNYSENTVEAYRHDLGYLMAFLKERGLAAVDAELSDMEEFAATLHEKNVSARSQSRILSGVRSFYRFLRLDGYMETDPTELLGSPQTGEHLPEYLSTEEVDLLEGSIDLSKWVGTGEPEIQRPLPRREVCPRHRQGQQGAACAHLVECPATA